MVRAVCLVLYGVSDQGLRADGDLCQRPSQLIDIIQGVIFLFFAAEQFLSKYRQKLVVKTAQEELAAKAALEAQKGGAEHA